MTRLIDGEVCLSAAEMALVFDVSVADVQQHAEQQRVAGASSMAFPAEWIARGRARLLATGEPTDFWAALAQLVIAEDRGTGTDGEI